jgi:hypothetical protein
MLKGPCDPNGFLMSSSDMIQAAVVAGATAMVFAYGVYRSVRPTSDLSDDCMAGFIAKPSRSRRSNK